MANFQNFAVTRENVSQITVQTHQISGQITDDAGNVLTDFTGPNAKNWPGVLDQLTSAQQDAIVQGLAQSVLLQLAGLQ